MEKKTRKHPRTGSHNLVSYVCLDERDQVTCEGLGRTVNVSEGGISLETQEPFDPSCTISLTLALEDELLDIKGRVVYSRKSMAGKVETGIRFLDSGEKIRLLRQFIQIVCGGSNHVE